MSTKMYEAYRIPRSKFDEFILTFNRLCFDAVKEVVLSYNVNRDVAKIRERLSLKDYSDDDVSLIWTLVQAISMSKQGLNDPLNIDCSFNVWFQDRWAYIQPFVVNALDLKARYPKWKWFERADYSYWDNSEEPDHVSKKEWAERAKVWNGIAFEDWHRTRLNHVVLEMQLPYLLGLSKLLKMINADDAWQDRIFTGIYIAEKEVKL